MIPWFVLAAYDLIMPHFFWLALVGSWFFSWIVLGFRGAGLSPKSKVWTSTNWMFGSFYSSLKGVGILRVVLSVSGFDALPALSALVDMLSFCGVETDLASAAWPRLMFYLAGLGLLLDPAWAAPLAAPPAELARTPDVGELEWPWWLLCAAPLPPRFGDL